MHACVLHVPPQHQSDQFGMLRSRRPAQLCFLHTFLRCTHIHTTNTNKNHTSLSSGVSISDGVENGQSKESREREREAS